jgi:tetratricopeptide (TPR) repeat protein
MTFNFSKIKVEKKEIAPIDPIELFQKLKITDTNINDLWLAQGDALRDWHQNRLVKDIGVVLNTGAGKTLVGLLIAQSLVNETKGRVIYACSSIQLVEQTVDKARGYGLKVSAYYRGKFSNDLYHRSLAPCITTYQAIFNGRSIFFREDLDAVVFDDAHTAEHLLRDHFSLQIKRATLPSTYAEVVALFREYHQKIGKAGRYSELENQNCQRLFLIPPFEIHKQYGELLRILNEAKLSESRDTTFAWEHINDHVDLCCILISGPTVTITPPFVPVRILPYFDHGTRRVYLSATLSASDAFARTFGCVPDQIVTPKTTAGECERLIIVPSMLKSKENDIELTEQLIENHKTLILVPTYYRATEWQGSAEPPPRESVSEHVTAFKSDSGTPKLLLAARYDGVDLPGDTCRVMVIDDLPMGVSSLERFLWEKLKLSNTLRTAIASRVIQSFGRISRGLSDHGVICLTGDRLVKWLLTPKNIATLPPFLQKQIMLGFQFSEHAESIEDLNAGMNQCFSRDEGWLNSYNNYIQNAEPENIKEDTARLTEIALSESNYAYFIWKRDYEAAAKCLRDTLEAAFTVSRSTGAWHALWLGRAFQLLGQTDSAVELFKRAHAEQFTIPAYPSHSDEDKGEKDLKQVVEVDRQFSVYHDGNITPPKLLNMDLVYLDGNGSSAQTEESLRALGQYLGLKASRPDNEFGTGPDVLWELEEHPSLCIEVKTGKKESSRYKKDEIGQLRDHVQWVLDNTDSEEVISAFIGPKIGATGAANPPQDFLVFELSEFKLLAEKLIQAYNDAAASSLPLTLRRDLLELFQTRDLLWPKFFEKMDKFILSEL